MGLSASKFTDLPKSSAGIQNFFKSAPVQTKEVGSSKQSDSTNSHNLVKHSTDKFHHLSFLKETCDDVKSIGKFEESSTKFGKSSRKIKPSSCNFQNSDQTELEKFQDNLEETSDKFVETADNHFNSKEESNSFFSKFFRCSNQILDNQCTESNHLDLYNSIDNPVYNQNNELEDSNSVTEGKVQKDSSNEMVNVSFENDKEHVKSTTVAGSNKQTSKNSIRSLFESHAMAKSEGTEHSNCKGINCTVSTSETESKPESTAKKKSNSIQNFFKNSEESVNPLDVFPDLNAIDDELLNSLPFSFRKKIIQLKESMEINVNSDIKESGSVNENPKKNIESFEMETKENSTGTCGNLFKFNEKSLNKSPIKGKRKKKARISPKDECKSSTESYFNVRPAKDISGEGLYGSNLSKTDSKPSCSKLKDVRQGSTSSDILNCDTKLVLLGNVDVFNENSVNITSSVNGFQSEHCCREIFEEKISKFPTELKDDNLDSNLNGLEVKSESKDGKDVIKSVDQQLPLPNNDLAKSDEVADPFRRDDIEKQNLITDRALNFEISRSKAGDRSNVAKCQDNRLVRNSTVGNEEVLKINDSSEVDWECQDMFETSEVTSHYFQEKCNQCCQLIPSDQYASHLDFHLAEKIHQEINSSQLSTDVYQLTNRLTRPTNQSVSAPLQQQTKTVSSKNISATSKRKLNTKEKKVSDSKKFKTLKTFFGT